ncbi:hypothetical protein RV18_GL002439 [Enterococcus termitis]|nr:hypothetical protein RV18_GL002439 [Enterococcus termitis]
MTDTGDNLLLNTFGNMIATCTDQELLKSLLPILIPYQTGMVKIEDIPAVIYQD